MSKPEHDMFDLLEALDLRLVAVGWPAMSPFWRKVMKRFLRSGKRWLIARIGRRGGKGVMAAKLAILFALHAVIINLTPGERAFVELLSVDKEEAAARLRMIEAGFKALKIEHHAVGDEIALEDPERPVTIRVRAASIRAVGGTAILVLEDEVSRWRDAATGSNPAREIHASIAAELLSQPQGRGCVFSAPFSEVDFHAQKYDEGETDGQCVAQAPTWIANPTISEADTKALEPDPRTWAREYAAQPVASITSIASKAELTDVIAKGVTKRPPGSGRYAMTLDAGFVNDAFFASVFHLEFRAGPDGQVRETVVQDAILHLQPTFLRKVSIDDAIAKVIALCREYRVESVASDFHYAEAISPRLRECGITLVTLPQTSPAITQRVETLRARIYAGSIDLLDYGEQTKEVLAAQLVAHVGGRLTLRAPDRRGAHDDCVSGLLLAVDGETVAKLPATEGDVIVKYGPIGFDAETRQITGGGAKYYRRVGKALVSREPPYGSTEFIRFAQQSIMRGEWTDMIIRFVEERGFKATPDFDPRKLDPRYGEDVEPDERLFVGVIGR